MCKPEYAKVGCVPEIRQGRRQRGRAAIVQTVAAAADSAVPPLSLSPKKRRRERRRASVARTPCSGWRKSSAERAKPAQRFFRACTQTQTWKNLVAVSYVHVFVIVNQLFCGSEFGKNVISLGSRESGGQHARDWSDQMGGPACI